MDQDRELPQEMKRYCLTVIDYLGEMHPDFDAASAFNDRYVAWYQKEHGSESKSDTSPSGGDEEGYESDTSTSGDEEEPVTSTRGDEEDSDEGDSD